SNRRAAGRAARSNVDAACPRTTTAHFLIDGPPRSDCHVSSGLSTRDRVTVDRSDMQRSLRAVGWLAIAVAVGLLSAAATAQEASALGGVWSLNRSISDIPREIGFNANWLPPAGAGGQTGSSGGGGGGGRGRRGSGGGGGGGRSGGSYPIARENYM